MSKNQIAAIVLGIVLGAGSYFAGGATIADAFTLAFDKTKATAYCTELLNGADDKTKTEAIKEIE